MLKKRILPAIMAIAMMLLFIPQIASASTTVPDGVYQGTVADFAHYDVLGGFWDSYAGAAEVVVSGAITTITCTFDDGNRIVISGDTTKIFKPEGALNYSIRVDYQDIDGKTYNVETTLELSYKDGSICSSGGKIMRVVYFEDFAAEVHVATLSGLDAVGAPQSTTQMFSTSTFASNTGEYEVTMSGRLKAELVPGKNVISQADINKMAISVIVYNTKTDEDRIQAASTIEGMEITVSGGKIASATISGRVMTPKGNLDRYTTTVNF